MSDVSRPAASATNLTARRSPVLEIIQQALDAAGAQGRAEERARIREQDWHTACNGLIGLVTIARGCGLSENEIVDKLREALTELGDEIAAALRAPEAGG